MPRACSRPRALLGTCAGLMLLALPCRVPAAPLAGLPLDEAISVLEERGLSVLYSTDLVKPWMRVTIEPSATEPLAALVAILEPHGLTTSSAANDLVLVIADPAADRRTPETPRSERRAVAEQTETGPATSGSLEEVVVSTSRYPLRRKLAGSTWSLGPADIENLPELGEDALRPVTHLPGMASNGVSARPHVRGGEIDETLVRLDGLRLYDPFHLKDFQSIFSAVDPRVVSSMDIYTGGFPAVFGDRMSSVIDVDSMRAPDSLYHEIGLSFFNSSLLSAGRMADDRGEWIVSARRSNLDLLYETFSELPERPRYLDAFAKLSFDINERLTVTGNFLRSTDDVALADDADREERAAAEHTDGYRWLTLDHRLANGMRGRTLAARTSLDSHRRGTSTKEGVSIGALDDSRSFDITTLQSEWSWAVGNDWFIELGGSASRMRGDYAYSDDVTFDLLFAVDGAPSAAARTRDLRVTANGSQYALHAAVRRRFTERLTADFGLRWDDQTVTPQNRATLGPRVGLRFAIGERTELRASAGRFYQSQAINELQISDGVTTFLPPQRADHFVIGIQRTLARGLGLRIEAYRKSMTDLRPRFENLLNERILLPELKPDRIRIAPDTATAHGIEIMLDARGRERLSGWVAYTWSRVEDRIGGVETPRSWDQPHALRSGLTLAAGRWDVGIGVDYRSGWPTTAVAFDTTGSAPQVTVVERNGERLDDYAAVNLLVTRAFALRRSVLTLSFELTNVFDRRNPCCVEYEIGQDDNEAGQFLLKDLSYLPTIPSIGVLWTF